MRSSDSAVRWTLILPSVFFFWILSGFDKNGISVIVTNHRFLADMHLAGQPVEIGLLASGFTLTYGLFAFVWGVLIDRWGARTCAVVSVTLWGVCMILGGASATYGEMLTTRLLLGAVEAALWPVSNKVVLDWFPFRERGRAQAGLAIGPPIGPAIGVPIILAILVSLGWRASFYIVGVLSWVVVIPLFVLLVRDRPEQHPRVRPGERDLLRAAAAERTAQARFVGAASARDTFHNSRYWLAVVGNAANNSVVFGLGFWIPTFLRARHLSVAAMGGWTSFAWAMAAGFIVVIGLLIDRTHRPALMGGIDTLLAIVFLIVASTTRDVGLVGPMLGLAFGCAGGQNIVEISLVARYSDSQATGRAFGVGWGVGGTVAAFFPTFMGYLYGLGHGGFLPPLLAVMGCYAVAAVVLLILSRGEASLTHVVPTGAADVAGRAATP